MVGTVCSSVVVDNLKNDKKAAKTAVADYQDFPRVYVAFCTRREEIETAIDAATSSDAVSKIMEKAHEEDRWDLA